QSLYTLPTSRASPFYRALPWCTARITLQDISKAQLTRNHPLRFPFLYRQECNITMLPLLPHRCSIPMLTPWSAPLEPQPTTSGDPKVSESSLLCQALPIISLVVVLYAGLQGSRTGPQIYSRNKPQPMLGTEPSSATILLRSLRPCC